MTQQLQKLKKNVLLQWIPAHCGSIGNETADLLAKKGSEVVVVMIVDLGFTTLLTSQVISIAFYTECEKSIKFCSEALISA